MRQRPGEAVHVFKIRNNKMRCDETSQAKI